MTHPSFQLLHIAGQGSFDLKEIVSEAEKREAVIKREYSRDSTSSLPPSSSSGGINVNDIRLTMTSIPEAEDEEEKAAKARKPPSEEAAGNNVTYGLKFCGLLLGSVLNSLASTFNRWSRDYRYVAFVLKGEKRRLKETLMQELEHENDFRRVRETLFNQEVSRKIHYIHSSRDIEM